MPFDLRTACMSVVSIGCRIARSLRPFSVRHVVVIGASWRRSDRLSLRPSASSTPGRASRIRARGQVLARVTSVKHAPHIEAIAVACYIIGVVGRLEYQLVFSAQALFATELEAWSIPIAIRTGARGIGAEPRLRISFPSGCSRGSWGRIEGVRRK